MRWQVIVMSLAIGVGLVVPCSAGLITNGSFETYGTEKTGGTDLVGLLLDGTSAPYTSTTALPGWTATSSQTSGADGVTNGLFAWVMLNGWSGLGTIPEGSAVLNFASSDESISQSFAVAAGTAYTVSYYDRYRDTSGCTLKATLGAAAGTLTLGPSTVSTPTGSGTSTLTQTTLGTSSAWTEYTFGFTASQSTTATLTFGSATGSDGVYLDNVSVTAIPTPEPTTIVLLTTGLLGLLAYAWRRRKRFTI